MPLCRAGWLCLLVMPMLLVACSSDSASPPLATHPVTGKLLDKRGQPVTQGMIEFAATEGASNNATGEIGPDGSFSLQTMNAEGTKFKGAEPGKYRVTYYPPLTETQAEVPITLRRPQTVEARENELTIKLE